MDHPTRWTLIDLLPEPVKQSLEEYLLKLEQSLVELEAMRDSLSDDISLQDFQKILSLLESINSLNARIGAYAELWLSEDQQNPAALNLRDRVEQVLTDAGNRALFFDLWFKELPDEKAANLISSSGDLQYFLSAMRQFKPYTLSEPEERMINIKDVNGIDAMVNLYEMITSKFTFTLEVDGERQSLTRAQLEGYLRNPSPELREAAYREMYRVLGENSTLLAQIYLHRVRDWNAEAVEMRGYTSPISARCRRATADVTAYDASAGVDGAKRPDSMRRSTAEVSASASTGSTIGFSGPCTVIRNRSPMIWSSSSR